MSSPQARLAHSLETSHADHNRGEERSHRGLVLAGIVLSAGWRAGGWLLAAPREEAVILTPKPAAAPRINGARVFGVRPGNPFLFTIPATGQRPMEFAVDGLPEGLKVDAKTGQITGSLEKRGEYVVTFRAKNAQGEAKRPFKIVCGDTLSLTPSMGWNDWYAYYDHVTDKLLREAADVMVKKGMADVGYQYVISTTAGRTRRTIPTRSGSARSATPRATSCPNKHFPDMKALTDYIHSRGLKAGIYTSPGPMTCAGYAGTWQHEAQDAKQFADWGFDLLKYDWCYYSQVSGNKKDLDTLKRPYILMGKLLKQQKRDILLNLCQYGEGKVWEWGAEVGGQSWRTAGDLGHTKDKIYEVALAERQAQGLLEAGRVERSRLPDYRQHRHRRGQGGAVRLVAERAIRLHVDVVPDGLAAVLQRRHEHARRLHAERLVQRRGDRGRSGPAGRVCRAW